MVNKDILNEIKPIISDPGWQVIVTKLGNLKRVAEGNYRAAKNYEEFLKTKSALDMVERIYEIFSKPNLLADDGIYKPGIPGIQA